MTNEDGLAMQEIAESRTLAALFAPVRDAKFVRRLDGRMEARLTLDGVPGSFYALQQSDEALGDFLRAVLTDNPNAPAWSPEVREPASCVAHPHERTKAVSDHANAQFWAAQSRDWSSKPVRGSGWQPMSTAPRDGQDVEIVCTWGLDPWYAVRHYKAQPFGPDTMTGWTDGKGSWVDCESHMQWRPVGTIDAPRVLPKARGFIDRLFAFLEG